jgi:hypothetical protein
MSFQTLKMKDPAEGYRVSKGDFPDLPMRMLIIGKSQLAGKTSLIGNFFLRPYDDTDVGAKDCYMKDFPGRNIYIVCPSTELDGKWGNIIKDKKIPDGNIFRHYDEQELTQLYGKLENDFNEAVGGGRKPEQTVVILDDCSFSGALKDKMHGVLTRIACNGRHCLVSMVITAQKYSQVLTTLRENTTAALFFECSNKQLDLIIEDHATIAKKDFIKMFRASTYERHTYMVVNYSNPPDRRYLNSNFAPIK